MTAPLPLAGVRVLDLASILAAPVAATFLGDFGADVVKVEQPGAGDFTRSGPGADDASRRSLQWVQEGRNKRSVTIDLHREEGRALVHDLVPHFDVVVLNFRPPTLHKWGLDPETLQRLNPRAVLLYVTGYGLTGPYSDRGAFDRIASSFAGLTYVSGEPSHEPVRSGYAVVDFMSAYLAAFATVTALYHRDLHGGTGQVIDLALYEAGFRASENAMLVYGTTGQVRERAGNRNEQIVPASDFDTADGRRVSVHAGTDALFARLAAVLDRPDLPDDPRFRTRADRVDHQDELYPVIAAWMARRSAADVVASLTDAGVPATPVMSIADIAVDPHYVERGTITTVQDPQYGAVPMVAPLPALSATPGRVRSLGPALGAHTDEVLREVLDVPDETLRRLHADGVIGGSAS